MKVELWYDPVYSETKIRLNGYWQKNTDIYGFLYPVIRYPLQTWLERSGSWQGLYRQLEELSRGEETELIFHGREEDFSDIEDALEENKGIYLKFSRWDMLQAYEDRLKEAEKLFAHGEKEEERWYFEAKDESGVKEAEYTEYPCILIYEEAVNSYERLSELEKLTSALKRPVDSICCIVEGEEKRRMLARYAGMFPKLRFRFLAAADKEALLEVYKKYGKPYQIKKRLFRAEEELLRIEEKCQNYTELKEKIQTLMFRQQEGILTEKEEDELEKARKEKAEMNLYGIKTKNILYAIRQHETECLEKGEQV